MTITTKTAKATAIALTAVIAVSAATVPAKAGGDAVAAGVIGFAAGTILGAATQPRYVQPAPVVVYQQPRHTHITPAGVSVQHANWCASRFNSYDWNTNTYVTFSGHVKQCR